MKTKRALSKSAKASIGRAIKECMNVRADLILLQNNQPLEDVMPRLRAELAELTKFIHEYNAYRNTLDT